MINRRNAARALIGACGPVALVGWAAASPASATTGTTACPGGTVSAYNAALVFSNRVGYIQGKGAASCSGTWQVTTQVQESKDLGQTWTNYGASVTAPGGSLASAPCNGDTAIWRSAVKAVSGSQQYGAVTNPVGASTPFQCQTSI
ncbi:MAG: hypothetical protein ACQSGP_00595 [Frankia sp.]